MCLPEAGALAGGGIGTRRSKVQTSSYKINTKDVTYNKINITNTIVCFTCKLLRVPITRKKKLFPTSLILYVNEMMDVH